VLAKRVLFSLCMQAILPRSYSDTADQGLLLNDDKPPSAPVKKVRSVF